MRIIGGSMGGRVLRPPMKGWPTRPTTDLSREALYNMLEFRVDYPSMAMLDLFGGTGAHSLEVASRGCSHVIYVDGYFKCTQWMKEIVHKLDLHQEIKVVRSDVKKFLRRNSVQFSYILADPPYDLSWIDSLPDLILSAALADNGILVIEHSARTSYTAHTQYVEHRNYGQTVFSFFASP